MIPDVGSTCRFVFVTKFSTLSGIYKIRAETTFLTARAGGIDFVTNLYSPAGLSQNDFNSDYASYLKDKVFVLESVIDSDVVYNVPESIILGVPDPTIKEYLNMIMVVTLGVQQNNQKVYPLLDQIQDLIRSTLGVTDPVKILANPDNKIYLTDAEYQALETARAANTKSLMPFSVQLKEAQDQIAFLAAKVAAYEHLIAQTKTS